MKSIFTLCWNKIDIKVKCEFKNYLLVYLSNKSTFTLDALKVVIQCLTTIVKFAWFDDPEFQKIVLELQKFALLSDNHQMIALVALDSLIQEMNYFNKGLLCVKY